VKAAFDTVDHEILLHKLHNLGFRGPFNKWLRSYLSDRPISTSVRGHISDSVNINIGVPQGSILGPILFLIFINDLLCNLSEIAETVSYADDTTVVVKAKTARDVEAKANLVLNFISDWFAQNQLVLNASKTNYISFSAKKSNDAFDITLNNEPVTRVFTAKTLGVVIHEHLKWEAHVDILCKKLSRAVGILYKLTRCIPSICLKNVYSSLFNSHLTYGISVWGNCSKKSLQRLLVLQKRALRIICRQPPLSHVTARFKQLGLLEVHRLYIEAICRLVYKFQCGLLPENIFVFTRNSSIHSYNTRIKENLHQQRTSTTCRAKLFVNASTKAWNSLPRDLREKHQHSFRRHLSMFLLNLSLEEFEEKFGFLL
jgi:hypothetical protein